MRAGDLRHRVSVQSSTEASDGHDGVTVTWATVRSRIAATVIPLAGRDLERARQIDPRASHLVTMRYWPDYATVLDGGRARLLYHDGASDRTLEIVESPREEDYRVSLVMTCKEAA